MDLYFACTKASRGAKFNASAPRVAAQNSTILLSEMLVRL
ncbi:hypothetical protein CAMSH0001_0684 [Campylobacter showae RM3277]|uniref:Uncharacterized protein n=1 Tax=Campylobacter showae RM3277 TaxID=553219 RepID=C6RGM7_9BACT|nr:hypothetical protein CAMSH0001_0684 [Campylobacter showae RM3277]